MLTVIKRLPMKTGILFIVIAALLLVSACASGATPSPTATPTPTAKATATATSTPTPTAKVVSKLPEVITFATLGATTAKYAQAAAFRQAVEKYTPMQMRVIPGEGFAERAGAVIKGRAEFTALGSVDVILWSKGTGEAEAFGPQPVRWVWRGEGVMGAFAVRGDSDIKKIADLKGKRVPQFTGSTGYNDEMRAYLAFGGLTLNDVKLVSVSSVSEGQGSVLSGQAEAASMSVATKDAIELAASRFGIRWLEMPPTDTEGWKRLNAVMPYKSSKYREAPGLKPGEKIWIADAGPTGIESMSTVSEDVVYNFCKAMFEGYNDYKNVSKELANWTWELAYDNGAFESVGVPYHDGTVKFFKEKGVWSPTHEAMQQKTLALEKDRLAKKK